MSDDNRKLRGRAPLTVVHGVSGVARHVYATQLVEPRELDPEDRQRLVDEGFLDWVVRGDGGWKLAEDGVAGSAGDVVTVSSAAIADPKAEPAAAGADTDRDHVSDAYARSDEGADGARSEEEEDTALAAKRAAAAAKLPADGSAPDGRASEDVWREYAVRQGMARDEVEKASKSELVAALKK